MCIPEYPFRSLLSAFPAVSPSRTVRGCPYIRCGSPQPAFRRSLHSFPEVLSSLPSRLPHADRKAPDTLPVLPHLLHDPDNSNRKAYGSAGTPQTALSGFPCPLFHAIHPAENQRYYRSLSEFLPLLRISRLPLSGSSEGSHGRNALPPGGGYPCRNNPEYRASRSPFPWSPFSNGNS